MLSYIVIFSIISSQNPIDFDDKAWDVLVESLKKSLSEKTLNNFVFFPDEKYLVQLRIFYPFMKSFFNPFVNIALTVFIAHLIHFPNVHFCICLFYNISDIIFAC